MKQHISVEQLQQLTEEQQQRLRELWKPKRFDVSYDGENARSLNFGDYNANKTESPLLNIGQMIELLRMKSPDKLKDIFFYMAYEIEDDEIQNVDDICDQLWEAIKSIL